MNSNLKFEVRKSELRLTTLYTMYPNKLNNAKTKKLASTAWTTGCPCSSASTTARVYMLASGWLVGRAPAEASLDRRQLEC